MVTFGEGGEVAAFPTPGGVDGGGIVDGDVVARVGRMLSEVRGVSAPRKRMMVVESRFVTVSRAWLEVMLFDNRNHDGPVQL